MCSTSASRWRISRILFVLFFICFIRFQSRPRDALLYSRKHKVTSGVNSSASWAVHFRFVFIQETFSTTQCFFPRASTFFETSFPYQPRLNLQPFPLNPTVQWV